jgi:hypothetical protein
MCGYNKPDYVEMCEEPCLGSVTISRLCILKKNVLGSDTI